MLEQIRRMFAQMDWANRRVLERLRATEVDVARARERLAHLLAAERVWLTRLRGQDSSAVPIWPDLTLDGCEELLRENRAGYEEFLDGIDEQDLERDAIYRNSKGTRYETPVGEILTHVPLHGSYHRGQIALLLRGAGGEPVNTDHITYVREI